MDGQVERWRERGEGREGQGEGGGEGWRERGRWMEGEKGRKGGYIPKAAATQYICDFKPSFFPF